MEASSDLAVIRARLPYVDRRALSEAWFAALRLGSEGEPQTMKTMQRRSGESDQTTPSPKIREGAQATPPAVNARHPSNVHPQNVRTAPDANRAGPSTRGASAKSMPSTGSRSHAPQSVAISFTIPVGDARVRVVARGDGNRLHLTAVCTAQYADLVRRALAHATLGLRRQGAFVEANFYCREDGR